MAACAAATESSLVGACAECADEECELAPAWCGRCRRVSGLGAGCGDGGSVVVASCSCVVKEAALAGARETEATLLASSEATSTGTADLQALGLYMVLLLA